MKKSLFFILAVAMLFACVTTSSATVNVAAPDEEFDGTLVFDVLRISHIVLQQTVNNDGNRAWNDYFDTTDEDPAYRVWVENTGDHPFKVYVKRGSASSNDIMGEPMTIAPGKNDYVTMTTDNEGNSPGRRWVVINPIQGNDFKATVRVRIAPSFDELG